ncbi:thyroid adenoma-associated protein homolog [Pogonomyrmex barbatus]|uniref:tRNA (32-2'-O)-methyltransferase regulator THADA n=1 Tax=Pogonomyrmex barbatus TaxID=144034 RepID=A0A6I9XGT0_9HYME|nr:thyroid adenoma-associated protein homolog [Pogonomyrmex barbatus]
MMRESKNMNESELRALLSNLRMSKQKGELDTDEKLAQQTVKWRNTLEYSVLETCAKHHSEECRLGMLALLVESKKSTLRFSCKELDMILLFLKYNLCEKMEYVPLIKKALKRLKDSLAVMQRQLAQEIKMRNHCKEQDITSEAYENALALSYQTSEQIERDVKDYITFFVNLREICVSNLYPDATYTRRRSSLQILLLMQDLLYNEFKDVEWKIYQANTIMQCLLLDTYEPNKEMAYQIIKTMNPTLLQITAFILQEALNLAKKNIGMAIINNSLYGHLFCIRSLLSDCNLRDVGMSKPWQNAIADIILLCFELNHTVSVIVNNSSPEGHLPMDLEMLNFNDVSFPEKEIITPQMVLLCSWRTVKEVSQLFGLLATKASIQTAESQNGLLTEKQIEHIMKHLVSLLCETKHRGAFEQVYVGFHQLCMRLWRSTNKTLNALPTHWLHNILIGITGLMPGYSKLCATRRSAGVPFMIQAVLSSEPKIHNNSEISTFHSVMKILLQFSQLENTINLWQKVKHIMYKDTIFSKYEHLTEPLIENRNDYDCTEIKLDVTEIKTHSMNILRALFRHSQLGDMVKNYIADGLIVAFRNYESKTWAECNAATLLFSALIIRIFGVQRTKDHVNLTTDNKMTGRIFFERYPNLLPFILNELRTFISINDNVIKSNVQAILLLLSRLYISYHFDSTDVTWKINEFVNLISQCAKSPVYETRKLVARALVPLLTEATVHNIVKKLFLILCTARDTRISMNLTHGYLLQILEILTRLPSVHVQLSISDVTNFLSSTDWILKGLEKRTNMFSCFLVASVYVDIIRELYNLNKNMIENCKDDILYILQEHLIKKVLLRQGAGEQIYKVSVIKFILCVGKNSNFFQTVHNEQSKAFIIYSRLLIMPEAEIQSITWTTVFEVLKKESNQSRELLRSYAICVAIDFAKNLYKYNPKLQDAIFDFLYNSLMDINECCLSDKRKICNLVLRELHQHSASNIYSQRVNYLRLLGKCMMTLLHELQDEQLAIKHTETVYRTVCDNNWISSLRMDFRSSIFDILYGLFEKTNISIEYYNPILDLWTVLLQLLLDDNADIRHEASKLLCRIKPCNELRCIQETLSIFFQIFGEMVADKHPEIAISALFCWSISLFGDTDYEMDETDVFNKCRNYDVFEPVRISYLCFDLVKLIIQKYSINRPLPSNVVRWINYHLDSNFHTMFSSFRGIVRDYRCEPPSLQNKLEDILDPTYKDKLLQILTYEKYRSL